MNSKIIQEKLEDLDKINFIARIYKINKGKNSQYSYFATIKKEEINRLSLKENDAILLEIIDKIFPTVIRKLKTSKSRFMLGFTIPYNISKELPIKKGIDLKLININNITSIKSIRNYPIYVYDLNDTLLVWIYSKGNKPYILPKSIPTNKNQYNIFEYAGAFFCEGFKARKENKHRDRFSFSNADPDQIKWFIEASENLLNISKQEWKVQILFPDLKENKNIINFWKKLKLNNIKIVQNKRVNAEYGVCILSIYNSSLAEIIYYLMDYLKKESLKSKENALQFFRGLSRGDLGVSEKDRSIKFSTESKENALFFRELCRILQISTKNIYHNKKGIKGYWGSNISISYNTLMRIIGLNAITHIKRRKLLYNIAYNTKEPKYQKV